MSKTGYERYIESANELEVIRPGENSTRKIRCTNLKPNCDHVQGIEIHGDEDTVFLKGEPRGDVVSYKNFATK